MNPDSIVDYVRWLDRRHNNLRDAVQTHRAMKTTKAIHGSVDRFDTELWAALDAAYEED